MQIILNNGNTYKILESSSEKHFDFDKTIYGIDDLINNILTEDNLSKFTLKYYESEKVFQNKKIENINIVGNIIKVNIIDNDVKQSEIDKSNKKINELLCEIEKLTDDLTLYKEEMYNSSGLLINFMTDSIVNINNITNINIDDNSNKVREVNE